MILPLKITIMDIKEPVWIPKQDGMNQSGEELNELVKVVQNHYEILSSQKETIELIQLGINGKVSPSTNLNELNNLPDGLYRAEREGQYLFDPPINMGKIDTIVISDNMVPVGFVVDFLKVNNKKIKELSF